MATPGSNRAGSCENCIPTSLDSDIDGPSLSGRTPTPRRRRPRNTSNTQTTRTTTTPTLLHQFLHGLLLPILLLVSLNPSRVSSRPNDSHHHHHGRNLTEGSVRLTGGQLEGTGNVLLYVKGEWGAVCDDGWNLEAAHVVCKAIGHPFALGYTNQAYFGVPKHSIQLDDVRCYGDEESILDCDHADWGRHNCDDREAAGVFCTPKSVVRSGRRPTTEVLTTTTTRPTTTSTTPTTTTTRPRQRPRQRHRPRPPLTLASSSRLAQPLVRPTNLPRHIVHTQADVFPYTQRQRVETEAEVETYAAFTAQTQTEVATHVGIEVLHEADADETGTLIGNATDPVLAEELRKKKESIQKQIEADKEKITAFLEDAENEVENKVPAHDNPHRPRPYDIRIVNGRSNKEGRVEVHIGGVWGLICSDNWSLLEARVACHQAGLGYAKMAARGTYFGGQTLPKVIAGVKCDGLEESLSDCYHEEVGDVSCPEIQYIAGVVCSFDLPDLVPNNTLLETSAYLQDLPMSYLQCAMEEGCAASSAYELKKNFRDWSIQRRRLLRFSSSTWNYGTADFRPFIPKNLWEWHMCHMHYHSMEIFAVYDLLDMNHNRVAEGHKASFCLEDVECLPGKQKRYECVGFNDQGISAGCADTYLHNIDCQWIDITDVKIGKYIFRVHINPEIKVAELDYTNNAATCDLEYTGYNVEVTNCAIGPGNHMPRPADPE